MTDEETSADLPSRLSVRLTDEEWERFNALKDAIQARANINVKVTNRTVVLEALEALERYFQTLERKR